MLDTQNQIDKIKEQKNDYAKIKTNILELILDNNALCSEDKIIKKDHSQPSPKYKKKISKKAKK